MRANREAVRAKPGSKVLMIEAVGRERRLRRPLRHTSEAERRREQGAQTHSEAHHASPSSRSQRRQSHLDFLFEFSDRNTFPTSRTQMGGRKDIREADAAKLRQCGDKVGHTPVLGLVLVLFCTSAIFGRGSADV